MAGEGKFMYIRSQMSDKVLTIQDGTLAPGQPVGCAPASGDDHQLWFQDRIKGVIRSKADTNLVLEIQDDSLVVNEYNPDEYNQKYHCTNNLVKHSEDGNCLDIAGCDDSDFARVCTWEEHGGDNQLWQFDHQPPAYCYIISRVDGKVMDVRDADMNPGAKVITWGRHDQEQDNQLWYEDKYGTIRCKMNDFVIDNSEGSCRLQEFDYDVPGRNWLRSGNKIVNRSDPSLCLQIMDAGDQGMRKHWKGRKLDAAPYVGAEHQQWDFEYI
jgi:hypothetical protein